MHAYLIRLANHLLWIGRIRQVLEPIKSNFVVSVPPIQMALPGYLDKMPRALISMRERDCP